MSGLLAFVPPTEIIFPPTTGNPALSRDIGDTLRAARIIKLGVKGNTHLYLADGDLGFNIDGSSYGCHERA